MTPPAPPPPRNRFTLPASASSSGGVEAKAEARNLLTPLTATKFRETYRPLPEYLPSLSAAQRRECASAVQNMLENEMRSLATKLTVANESIFNEFDRLSAEATLRFSISLPMGLMVAAATWRFSFWAVIALLLPVLLIAQAIQRRRDANELLVQAVMSGIIGSTEIDRMTKKVVNSTRVL